MIGILGGIGPESTIDYYRHLFKAHRERTPDGSAPAVIINSIDMNRMLGMIGQGKHAEVTMYLAEEINRLARAGAQVALMAANTPHIAFKEIASRASIPLVSIVEATSSRIKSMNLQKVGLFGTRFTMQGGFYPEVLSRDGITVTIPSPEEQDYIHDKYMNELVQGKFLPSTRERLLAIASRMAQQDGIQGLILGGTELPLILTDSAATGIPFLDTTEIHVKAIVAEAIA
jgi:aspartate racemase